MPILGPPIASVGPRADEGLPLLVGLDLDFDNQVCRAAMRTSRSLRERAALCLVTAMWDELATNSSTGTAELAEQVELVAGVQARILGHGVAFLGLEGEAG